MFSPNIKELGNYSPGSCSERMMREAIGLPDEMFTGQHHSTAFANRIDALQGLIRSLRVQLQQEVNRFKRELQSVVNMVNGDSPVIPPITPLPSVVDISDDGYWSTRASLQPILSPPLRCQSSCLSLNTNLTNKTIERLYRQVEKLNEVECDVIKENIISSINYLSCKPKLDQNTTEHNTDTISPSGNKKCRNVQQLQDNTTSDLHAVEESARYLLRKCPSADSKISLKTSDIFFSDNDDEHIEYSVEPKVGITNIKQENSDKLEISSDEENEKDCNQSDESGSSINVPDENE